MVADMGLLSSWFRLPDFTRVGHQFFRMPTRSIGSRELEDVLCPSDGKVVVIEKVQETEWFKDERIQVSIFMSPLNVHAQWSPDGRSSVGCTVPSW
jgi:phosphatidylserine decarboxylase